MRIRNLGALIQDRLREEFISDSFKKFGRRSKLLDLGCGIKPFQTLYAGFSETSVGIDVEHSPHGTSMADRIYDGKKIPFDDNTFDYVLCTEVLEHVPDPKEFLMEIRRVMKPGAVLIMTIPFMVPLHEEPYDFYRYTKYGLKHMLDGAGFASHDITPFSEYYGVLL